MLCSKPPVFGVPVLVLISHRFRIFCLKSDLVLMSADRHTWLILLLLMVQVCCRGGTRRSIVGLEQICSWREGEGICA